MGDVVNMGLPMGETVTTVYRISSPCKSWSISVGNVDGMLRRRFLSTQQD